MPRSVVIFGGSFNPPGNHHVEIARRLAERFDEVIVVPCGPRPDKETTNDVDSVHRATMCDLAFGHLPKVRVDLFDLESNEYTKTKDLPARYALESDAEIWHCVGADLVEGGSRGASQIHSWEDGARLWNEERFVVCGRDGHPIDQKDLPPHAVLMTSAASGASSTIREQLVLRKPTDDLVPDAVRHHIERHGLYRGRLPLRSTVLKLDEMRPLIVSDLSRERAKDILYRCGFSSGSHGDPNCVLAVGGDGTMLHAIREHWRLRLPFIGINAGTIGFLLNEETRAFPAGTLLKEWNMVHHPLLSVEFDRTDGSVGTALGFNEAWIERIEGQTAWTDVSVDGKILLRRLMSDGVLVATPAGTCAYASSMGARPLPLDEPTLTIVGNNVFRPHGWKVAPVSQRSTIDLVPLDTGKRPVRLFVDGVLKGPVTKVRIRASRTASAALAFAPSYDMAAKVIEEQYGRGA
jgi:nicotinate (nicotinamide) nucleotide adenylyltransferase